MAQLWEVYTLIYTLYTAYSLSYFIHLDVLSLQYRLNLYDMIQEWRIGIIGTLLINLLDKWMVDLTD